MLYELAMTPDLFDVSVVGANTSHDVILVQILRGIAENGLLANLNKDRWMKYIQKEKVPYLPPGLKDRVITCFNVLHSRHRLSRHPRSGKGDPQSDSEWLDLAMESHQKIPFYGIVLSKMLMDTCGHNDSSFIEFSESLNSSLWLERRRTIPLNKCETDYRSTLTPILRHAKSLSLVDPYLNSQESRYFDMVRICSEVMGQRVHARLQGRIHIHAEVKHQGPKVHKTLDEYLKDWEQKLRPLKSHDGHRFKVFLWESLPGSENPHDRFILTDQCGISAPGGLDCRTHSHANNTNWILLDEEDRLRRLQDYDPATSPFQFKKSIEVI